MEPRFPFSLVLVAVAIDFKHLTEAFRELRCLLGRELV